MPDYTLNEYIKENNTYNEKRNKLQSKCKNNMQTIVKLKSIGKANKEMSSIKYYQIPHNR